MACLTLAALGVSQLIGLKSGVEPGTHFFVGVGLLVLTAFFLKGLFQVAPNDGQVLQLFGKYAGTVREEGLRWTNPFYSRRRVSLRVRNFESGKLKVNDNDGNPIEIAAVVVWQVLDTAEAVFCVDDYENCVHIQSESALRQMAQNHPYDAHDEKKPSLRSHGEVINNHLRDEIQARLEKAGVQVIEARISHLAYAQEIAQAMLQRQQANAIVAARERIVEGAVGMVWWRWRWTSCASRAWSSWTKSARRRWSATCWWCCAAIAPPSPWSTPAACTAPVQLRSATMTVLPVMIVLFVVALASRRRAAR